MENKGISSIGIKMYNGDTELTGLLEVAELGGEVEAIEVTTLSDTAHVYIDGLKNYGDSLAFKFLYEKEQFTNYNNQTEAIDWRVELPDGATCSFSGTCSVKLDSVGTNAALTYTLSIKPTSEMVWA